MPRSEIVSTEIPLEVIVYAIAVNNACDSSYTDYACPCNVAAIFRTGFPGQYFALVVMVEVTNNFMSRHRITKTGGARARHSIDDV